MPPAVTPAFLVLPLAAAIVAGLAALVLRAAARRAREACGLRLRLQAECRRRHDDRVLQSLQGVLFQMQAAQALLPARPGEAAKVLGQALDAGDATVRAMLRRAGRDERRASTRDLAAQLVRAAGTLVVGEHRAARLSVFDRGRPRRLRRAVHDALLLAGCAALTAALHGARGGHVQLELASWPDGVSLRLRAETATGLAAGAAGAFAELQRLCRGGEAIGVRLEIRSARLAGTELTISLALRPDASAGLA